jgi:hypothetical protein
VRVNALGRGEACHGREFADLVKHRHSGNPENHGCHDYPDRAGHCGRNRPDDAECEVWSRSVSIGTMFTG